MELVSFENVNESITLFKYFRSEGTANLNHNHFWVALNNFYYLGYFHFDQNIYMSLSTNGSHWQWASGISKPKGWQPLFGSCAGHSTNTNRTYISARQTYCTTTDSAVSAYTLCESKDNMKRYNYTNNGEEECLISHFKFQPSQWFLKLSV
jgi:hypothetical protein